MKRYIQRRETCPVRCFTPEYAEDIFDQLKRCLYIDRGAFWESVSDAEDAYIHEDSLLYCDDVAHPWHDGGYREIAWMPSYDPEDEYEFHQWGSLTFEEFLAFFNITITEKYPERVA